LPTCTYTAPAGAAALHAGAGAAGEPGGDVRHPRRRARPAAGAGRGSAREGGAAPDADPAQSRSGPLHDSARKAPLWNALVLLQLGGRAQVLAALGNRAAAGVADASQELRHQLAPSRPLAVEEHVPGGEVGQVEDLLEPRVAGHEHVSVRAYFPEVIKAVSAFAE